MRALLVAMTCEKGQVKHNLQRHVAHLTDAAAAGCDLVVFPEMSLTGYLSDTTGWDQAQDLRSAAVVQLAEATERTGVAALFGMVERAEGERFVTQVLASDGHMVAWYRKRHLGEDEAGLFAAGRRSQVFTCSRVSFTVAICAESGDPAAFQDAAAAGAPVVFCCAAPGLDRPRRTTEAAWRDGYDWWRNSAGADLTEHARRHGLSIGVATQAGATIDEDFPGWCAVIDPAGTIVDELSDWQEGTLVMEVPSRPPRFRG